MAVAKLWGSMFWFIPGRNQHMFPQTLKEVVREIVPGNLVDQSDHMHASVSVFSLLSILVVLLCND